MSDFNFSDHSLVYEICLFAGAIVAGLVLHFIIHKLLKRGYFFKDKQEIREVSRKLSMPVRGLLILIFVFIIYPRISWLGPTFKHILSILLIINVAWVIIKVVRVLRVVIMTNYDLSEKDNLRARKAYTQFHLIENIVVFLIILISIGVILMTFDGVKQVGVSLLTSAGIAGIILGFAAQKLIATILAGIQIAITQPIRIDDVVIVEGEWGRIEEINLTFVVVSIWDQRRLVLPTTYFIEKPFQNWTRTTSQILGTIFIYTDYNIPFEAIRKELTRLLEASPLWDKRVNVLQVTDAKERTVEIRALVSAGDAGTAWDLRVFIREKLIEFIRDHYPDSLPHTRVTVENTKEQTGDKEKPGKDENLPSGK